MSGYLNSLQLLDSSCSLGFIFIQYIVGGEEVRKRESTQILNAF